MPPRYEADKGFGPLSPMPYLELRLPHLLGTPEALSPQALLKKTIEYGKEIARSHFFDFELGYPLLPVTPAVWYNSIPVTAYDRFQRKLDCEIEVLRQQGLDARNYSAAIHLKCVR